MIELNLKIFKFTLDLKVTCKCDKHVKNAEELPSNFYDENNELEYAQDEIYTPSDIEIQANKFEEELKQISKIYDIPNAEDVPPKYGIQDDVEIITDSYEKEIEDILEGRR